MLHSVINKAADQIIFLEKMFSEVIMSHYVFLSWHCVVIKSQKGGFRSIMNSALIQNILLKIRIFNGWMLMKEFDVRECCTKP